MTLAAAQYTFLRDVRSVSDTLLSQYGKIAQIDALWNGSPNYKETLTQETIDSITSLLESGYTLAEINDAVYALAIIKGTLTTYLPALSRLADLP